MANQLVTFSKLQQPRNYKYMKVSSRGEITTNAPLSRRCEESCNKAKLVHNVLESSDQPPKNENGSAGKNKKSSMDDWMKKQNRKSRHSPAFHLMRFWFLRSSVNYLLKKMKFHKFSGSKIHGKNSRSSEIEAASSHVEAYFSIPVVIPTNNGY